jgi:predicted NAD-dependent protein-ADP-ribosyltransferase YbiA (DUF1768 family)
MEYKELSFGPDEIVSGGAFLSNAFPYVSSDAKLSSQKIFGVNPTEGGFVIQGSSYKSVEHYLAYMKFKTIDSVYAQELKNMENINDIIKKSTLNYYLQHSKSKNSHKIAQAYNKFKQVENEVYDRALSAKFNSNPTLHKALISTHELILHPTKNEYNGEITADRLMNLRGRISDKLGVSTTDDEILLDDFQIEDNNNDDNNNDIEDNNDDITVEAGDVQYDTYGDDNANEDNVDEVNDKNIPPPQTDTDKIFKKYAGTSKDIQKGASAQFIQKSKIYNGKIVKINSDSYDIEVDMGDNTSKIYVIKKDNSSLKIQLSSQDDIEENDDGFEDVDSDDEIGKSIEEEAELAMEELKKRKLKFDITDVVFFKIEDAVIEGKILSINNNKKGKPISYVISANGKRFVVPIHDSSLRKKKNFIPEIPIGSYVSVLYDEDDDIEDKPDNSDNESSSEVRLYGRIISANSEKYKIAIEDHPDIKTLTVWADDDSLQVEKDPAFEKDLEKLDEERSFRLLRMKKKIKNRAGPNLQFVTEDGKRIKYKIPKKPLKKKYWVEREEEEFVEVKEPMENEAHIRIAKNKYVDIPPYILTKKEKESDSKKKFKMFDYIREIQQRNKYAYTSDEVFQKWEWKDIPIDQLRHQIGERVQFEFHKTGEVNIPVTGIISNVNDGKYIITSDIGDNKEYELEINRVNVLDPQKYESEGYYTMISLLATPKWKEAVKNLTTDERLSKLLELFEAEKHTTQFIESNLRTTLREESKRVEQPLYDSLKILNLSSGLFLKVPSGNLIVDTNASATNILGLTQPPEYMREAMVTYLSDQFLHIKVPQYFKKNSEISKFTNPIPYDSYVKQRYNQWNFKRLRQSLENQIDMTEIENEATKIYSWSSISVLIASIKFFNPQFFLLSREKMVKYLSNKLNKSILEIIILDELVKNIKPHEEKMNISSFSISGYQHDDPRVEYTTVKETELERPFHNYKANGGEYLKYNKKSKKKEVLNFYSGNHVASRQEVANEITNAIERYVMYYSGPSITHIRDRLKLKRILKMYFEIEYDGETYNKYMLENSNMLLQDYKNLMQSYKSEFDKNSISEIDRLKVKLVELENKLATSMKVHEREIIQYETTKKEMDSGNKTLAEKQALLAKIEILSNIDSIQEIKNINDKIKSVKAKIESEIKSQDTKETMEISISNVIRDSIRNQVKLYEDMIFLGYEVLNFTSGYSLNTSEYIKMCITPLIFLTSNLSKYAKYFNAQFMSDNIQIKDLASLELQEYLPELFMNSELSKEKIQNEHEKISISIDKQAYDFVKYVSSIIGVDIKTLDEKEEEPIDESLLVTPQDKCENKNDIPLGDLVIDRTIDQDGNPIFTCHSIKDVIENLKKNPITGGPYSSEFTRKMYARWKDKIGVKNDIEDIEDKKDNSDHDIEDIEDTINKLNELIRARELDSTIDDLQELLRKRGLADTINELNDLISKRNKNDDSSELIRQRNLAYTIQELNELIRKRNTPQYEINALLKNRKYGVTIADLINIKDFDDTMASFNEMMTVD